VNHLFKIVNPNIDAAQQGGSTQTKPSTRPYSAPQLVPVGFTAADGKYRGDTTSIDVVNDFYWTNTPKSGRKEVPTIIIKEQVLKYSSHLQNVRYLYSAVTDINTFRDIAGRAVNTVDDILSQNSQDFLNKLISTNVPVLDAASSKISNALSDSTKLNSYLKPYAGIYPTAPTGFVYKFPYFEENWRDGSQQWSESKTQSVVSKILEGARSLGLEGAIPDLNVLTTGGYLETPKFFDFQSSNNGSISFTFKLSNTSNIDDVIKNWELCFLLFYQNLANRTSKILIEPPVLYEVLIPGLYYMPYAYISALKIKQIGTTREYTLPVLLSSTKNQKLEYILKPRTVEEAPAATKLSIDRGTKPLFGFDPNAVTAYNVTTSPNDFTTSSIKTVVPEAYEISITLQPLISETKNLLYHTVVEGNSNSVYDVSVLEPEPTKKIQAPAGPKTSSTEIKTPFGPIDYKPSYIRQGY